jgi:ornithine cyclodeaminase/alanine dehydrogenase-like protein (mu-crystallin family)
MKSEEILLLTSGEIQRLLTLDECIGAVEQAFRAYGEGRALPPSVLSMHTEGGGFHVKAGLLELGRSYFAAKVNGNFPENGLRFGLPTIQGVIILCDGENGTPLAVMDSRDITSLRTAGATAVAAKCLAREDSRTITICGCGNQGRVQLKALSSVFRFETVFAYDRDGERALRFSEDLTSDLGISVNPVSDLHAAVRQSDICVTCTTSRQPLLGYDDVLPGTFIAAVGADNPQKQELHPNLMARSKMGDLHHALDAGVVTRANVHAELGDIVAGKKAGRESPEEIIIFDSTGMALQDVAAAAFMYEKAQRNGSGVRLDFAA